MNIKTAAGTLLLLALGIGGVWYWQAKRPTPAPNATFTSINGQTLSLNQLRGKPVLVTFWATDCPSCVEEIPHLIELHQHFAEQGLTIIAVAMPYDPPNHVVALAASKQLPYFVALDPSGTLSEAFDGVQLTPTTFLIDRNGYIVTQKLGAFDPDALRQRLETL